MINYTGHEWKNTGETGAIPLSAANLNGMEAGIKAACDYADAQEAECWKKINLGELDDEAKLYMYNFNGDRVLTLDDVDTTHYIYYADSYSITVSGGAMYMSLENPTSLSVTASVLSSHSIATLRGKYFIVDNQNTSSSGFLFYMQNSANADLSGDTHNGYSIIAERTMIVFRGFSSPSSESYITDPSEVPSVGAYKTDGNNIIRYESCDLLSNNSKNSVCMLQGLYEGNGLTQQKITTSHMPKFVMIGARREYVNGRVVPITYTSITYADILSGDGTLLSDIILLSDGFIVNHSELCEPTTYRYVVFY